MDPTTAIIAPWAQLGIVGSVVLALGAIAYLQWRHIHTQNASHMADVKACGDKHADLLVKKIESDNALANAINLLSERVKS